jgi:DNA repair protein RAD50
MICTRSLAVSLKKNTVSQKAIDNSLLRYDSVTGEAFSISSRCADMDAELPMHLGVPKAILDNVVFCHQEDSNWPFSEPSLLKKKFDDIFSSKRYAVALDNIKEIRKETAQEIQVGNVRLEALKSDTVKAKKIRETLTQMNQQVTAKTETLTTIESRINNIAQEVVKLNDVFREIDLTADQIQQIINKKDFYTATLKSLESHITPRSESTAELKKMLNDINVNQDAIEKEKLAVVTEKSKLERRLKKIQDELSQKHLIMGRLEAAIEEHQKQIQLRADLITKTNQEHGMKLPTHDGLKTASLLKRNLQAHTSKNNKAKEDATTKENAITDELQVLKSRLLSIQENKKHLLSRIVSNHSCIIPLLLILT